MNQITRSEVVRYLSTARQNATGDPARMLTRAIDLLNDGNGCAYCWQIDKLGERRCSNCHVTYGAQEWHHAVSPAVCDVELRQGAQQGLGGS